MTTVKRLMRNTFVCYICGMPVHFLPHGIQPISKNDRRLLKPKKFDFGPILKRNRQLKHNYVLTHALCKSVAKKLSTGNHYDAVEAIKDYLPGQQDDYLSSFSKVLSNKKGIL